MIIEKEVYIALFEKLCDRLYKSGNIKGSVVDAANLNMNTYFPLRPKKKKMNLLFNYEKMELMLFSTSN